MTHGCIYFYYIIIINYICKSVNKERQKECRNYSKYNVYILSIMCIYTHTHRNFTYLFTAPAFGVSFRALALVARIEIKFTLSKIIEGVCGSSNG